MAAMTLCTMIQNPDKLTNVRLTHDNQETGQNDMDFGPLKLTVSTSMAIKVTVLSVCFFGKPVQGKLSFVL